MSGEYSLAPGDERYVCTTHRSPPEEVGIVEVQQTPGLAVHHVAVFQTTIDEPEGTFDCPVLVKQSWLPIWASGAGGAGLTMPEGVAFKIRPNTQYLVQYHLLNAGDAPVTERSVVSLRYDPEPDALEAAGLFALGSFDFSIPPGATDHSETVSCASPLDMHAFAAFPHMHQLGTQIRFDRGASEAQAAMTYEKNPWQFGNQPMDPMDIVISEGEFLRAQCRWRNDGDAPVTYGESSNDEMCFFIIFYYPFEGLNGCFNGFDG